MERLYHYCSTATFHAIVTGRSLQLSALSLSNDTLEGKIVTRPITRLARREGLPDRSVRLLLLKARAFREEQEWRLVAPLVQLSKGSADPETKFRFTRDRIIPAKYFELHEHQNSRGIVDVILGPKHRSPAIVIESILRKSGFLGVSLRSSSASYR